MTDSLLSQQVAAAADSISRRFDRVAQFGIVLGTGAGVLAASIEPEAAIDYDAIPHFPASTALGHKGRLVCGTLGDQPVIAMDGRFHLYEGHNVDAATLPIRAMYQLGVRTLFITNASGGINPNYRSGDIMAIRSHVDLMFRTSQESSIATAEGRPTVRTDIYDDALIEHSSRCARRQDFVLHQGTYAALMGPTYETRAEYRMLRRIGADVAGMSTVPEVVLAAKLGLRVLALSVITNVAKPDALATTSGQEVIDAAEVAAPRIESLVLDCIGLVS